MTSIDLFSRPVRDFLGNVYDFGFQATFRARQCNLAVLDISWCKSNPLPLSSNANSILLDFKSAILPPMVSGYHKLREKIHNSPYLKNQSVIVPKTELAYPGIIRSKTGLARIASGDEPLEVRETSRARLEEIQG